jgi:hypothetical protein
MMKRPTQEDINENINKKCEDKNYVLLDDISYLKNKKCIHVKCLKNDFDWYVTYDNFMHLKRGCIECYNESKIKPPKIIKSRKKDFLSYNEAVEYLKSFKFKTKNDYLQWRKLNKIKNLTAVPNIIYKDKGWISWGVYLGNNFIRPQEKTKLFLSYEDAKKYLKDYNFILVRNYFEWHTNYNINYLPLNPHKFYKNSGWISFNDYFGCDLTIDTKTN